MKSGKIEPGILKKRGKIKRRFPGTKPIGKLRSDIVQQAKYVIAGLTPPSAIILRRHLGDPATTHFAKRYKIASR